MRALFPRICVLLGLLLASCSTESQPAAAPARPPVPMAARPKVTILSAQDLGGGRIEVKVRLENLSLPQYEMNVGLGYNPTEEQLSRLSMGTTGSNYNMSAQKQVVDREAGEITVILDLKRTKLPTPFNGMIHVNLSEYPHGAQWSPVARDRMELKKP